MRSEKKFIIEELANEMGAANPLVFTDYSRLKANDLNQLRMQLKTIGSRYRVVQNSLFQRALENVGLGKYAPQFTPLESAGSKTPPFLTGFTGPLAVAYGGKDVIEVIKTLIKFVKDYPDSLVVKSGVVDSQYLELSGLEELAKLPPKGVLLACLIGQMNAPLSRFALVLRGNLQKLVCVLDGIAKKL